MAENAQHTADVAYATTLKVIRDLAESQLAAEARGVTVTRHSCLEQLTAAVDALADRSTPTSESTSRSPRRPG